MQGAKVVNCYDSNKISCTFAMFFNEVGNNSCLYPFYTCQ